MTGRRLSHRPFRWLANPTRALFECTRCDETLVLPNVGGRSEPEIVRFATNKGWMTGRETATCPACKRPSRTNDPDSELRNFTPKEPVPMTVPKPDPQPTTHQRVAIRNLLDKHFDDDSHRYLEGWTDDKIAEEVKVPRVVVERIREVGYGPWVKEDPEITAIKAMIARIETDLAATKARLAKAIG